MVIRVRVQEDTFNPGYISVIPLVSIYCRDLKDYLGTVTFTPDSDWGIFPGEALERLVDYGEPFVCEVELRDICDPETCYIVITQR